MDEVVDQLDAVLKEKFGCPEGVVKSITYSDNTSEAFQQLVDALKECQVAQQVSNLYSSPAGENEEQKAPEVGDIAYVFWGGHGWFTARIENWFPDELNYSIRWTDGNWAPERAFYKNLCVDRVPDASTIGVGTKVLFQQGLYWCGYNDDGTVADSSGRTLSEAKKAEIRGKGQVSDRWHMGQVTRVYKDEAGQTLYEGMHVTRDDSQASHSNYAEYSMKFTGLKIEQLRTTPNIFNCLDSGDPDEGEKCDIFVSKVFQDNKETKSIMQHIKSKYNVAESKDGQTSSASLQKTVSKVKNCTVYCVCLSDNFIQNSQAMSELLYAKKTLQKTVIPIVIGPSAKWCSTTAGMLLAGQLYIQFRDADAFEEKIQELSGNLEKLVIGPTGPKQDGPDPRVFLSYCWTNSKSAHDAEQVGFYTGHEYSDPRKIKEAIEEKIGERVWLDIEQLDSVDDSGMFGQIAEGLLASEIVVMCVSKEYSNSQNCQMEANFALRSIRKKAIVLEVGTGEADDRDAWMRSSVGMVLPTDQEPYVMTQGTVDSYDTFLSTIERICEQLKEEALMHPPSEDLKVTAVEDKQSSLRQSVPMVGDSVICRYAAWQFFPAKVVAFDSNAMNYTVNWDDPDPTNRVQPYNMVAVNREPTADQIGIGSKVLFIQGRYSYGDSSGDVWNLGEITQIEEVDGEKLYSGKHSKTEADGLAVAKWSSFRPTFERHTYNNLRLFPNAIEMLQAYKNM